MRREEPLRAEEVAAQPAASAGSPARRPTSSQQACSYHKSELRLTIPWNYVRPNRGVLIAEGVAHHNDLPSKFHYSFEWVTLLEPDEIRFEGVEGPLDLLQDRFLLQDVVGCTRVRYESTIGIAGGIAGWLKAQFFVRPVLKRFMREHALKLKRTIEERAKRSLVVRRQCRA